MIRYRIRRLLKFRDSDFDRKTSATSKRPSPSKSTPAKFAKVFRLTASAYREAVKFEKKFGHLPQEIVHKIILRWANDILKLLSVDVEIKGVAPELTRPVLFVGNHISYVDIPLLMACVPVVFVAKKEVSRWLIIGQASRKAGTVFVKRENGKSRSEAAETIAEAIVKHKRSIGVFPSGTTTIGETKPWRHGAFKIAHAHSVPVQPFRIRYEPLRKVAYIDKDNFATHLLALLRINRIKAIIEFDEVRFINDPIEDSLTIRNWTVEPLNEYSESHK